MSVKLDPGPTSQQEVTVRAVSQAAVDLALWTVRQRVESFFARDAQSNAAQGQAAVKMV